MRQGQGGAAKDTYVSHKQRSPKAYERDYRNVVCKVACMRVSGQQQAADDGRAEASKDNCGKLATRGGSGAPEED